MDTHYGEKPMIKAVRDTIIVSVEYAEKIGSVIVPDQAKQYHGSFTGKVIAIGQEYPYQDELKVGDTIWFRRHEGHKVIVGDKTYLSLRNKWVVAKGINEKR